MQQSTLQILNETDAPWTLGGKFLGDDGQGNQLWLFRTRVANRYRAEDGAVLWSGDVQNWGYTNPRDVVPI